MVKFTQFRLCGLIVRVRVVPRMTVVGDVDRCFDNQQCHVNCVFSVCGILVSIKSAASAIFEASASKNRIMERIHSSGIT